MKNADRLDVDEKTVRGILFKKSEKLKNIEQRKQFCYSELNKGMEAYALPSSPILDGMPRGTGWYNDLSDFLVRVSEEHEQHMKEMSNLLQTLYKMEDRIERVWQCFWVLPDPAFDILKSLYVEGKLYDAVIKEQKCSKTALRRRSSGIWITASGGRRS